MNLPLHPTKKDLLVTLGFIVVAILLVGAGILSWKHYMESAPYVDSEIYPVRGIDVSSHNGDIDFKAAAGSGVEFVFIKASEGVDFRDPMFEKNYLKARMAGLKTGAYHFFRFDRDGVEQARNIVAAVGGRHLDLGIAIDVEKHHNANGVDPALIMQRLSAMAEFLNLVGYRVTFYSNRDDYLDFIHQAAPGAPLWICSFTPVPSNIEWTFWQYDHRGKVAGVKGDVDLNAFCGSRDDWDRFLNGAVWPYTHNLYPKPLEAKPSTFGIPETDSAEISAIAETISAPDDTAEQPQPEETATASEPSEMQ